MNTALSPGTPSVCIVIPVCNEEESLSLLRSRLKCLQRSLSKSFRVHYLLVDDGSTDETTRLLATAVPHGATYEVHTHATNLGLGAAFRTAFQHAAADVVCTIDADCSYGPEHLLAMIEEVAAGRTDVMVASPYHPQGGVDGVQRWRLLLSAQCSRLYRAVSPLKLYTYTSIFRAYKGSFVREAQFRSDGFVAAVEILLSASYLGLRVSELPLTLRRRSAGASKMRIARTIGAHARLLANCLFAGNCGHPSFCYREAEMIGDAPTPYLKSQYAHAHDLHNGRHSVAQAGILSRHSRRKASWAQRGGSSATIATARAPISAREEGAISS